MAKAAWKATLLAEKQKRMSAQLAKAYAPTLRIARLHAADRSFRCC